MGGRAWPCGPARRIASKGLEPCGALSRAARGSLAGAVRRTSKPPLQNDGQAAASAVVRAAAQEGGQARPPSGGAHGGPPESQSGPATGLPFRRHKGRPHKRLQRPSRLSRLRPARSAHILTRPPAAALARSAAGAGPGGGVCRVTRMQMLRKTGNDEKSVGSDTRPARLGYQNSNHSMTLSIASGLVQRPSKRSAPRGGGLAGSPSA